jgi:CheY-like chemotaxis protein
MSQEKKILIVDDDADIVEAIKIVLESKSYKVTSASNGKEGIKRLKADKPDLIILDVMMTRTDEGFDVCREVKKDPRYKNIPILMLTALKEKTGFDFKSEAGDEDWLPVEDYIDKPIQPDQLLERVAKLLEKK